MKGKYCIFYEGSLGGTGSGKTRATAVVAIDCGGGGEGGGFKRKIVASKEDQSCGMCSQFAKGRRIFRALYYPPRHPRRDGRARARNLRFPNENVNPSVPVRSSGSGNLERERTRRRCT